MWNTLHLKCPSHDLTEYPPQDRCLAEDLRNFVTVLSNAANLLTSEDPIWVELEALYNIQAKYKRLLHCDRCMVHLHRVAHCLKKMVLLNLSRSYLDLAENFLVGLQGPSMTLHLPSRQQLEYILIRTITASRLMCEGINYSRKTFCYLIQRLKIGHLILDLVMASSVIARLNILLRATLEQICSTYQQLLSWRYKLKRGTHDWEKKLDLPPDLKEWLKNSESQFLEPFPMTEREINKLSNLINNGTNNDETVNNGKRDSDEESIVEVATVRGRVGVVNKRSSLATPGVAKDQPDATDDDSDDVQSVRTDLDVGEVVPRTSNIRQEPNTSTRTKEDCQLTPQQISMLAKILQVRCLRDLEKLWREVQNYSSAHFPAKMTDARRRLVNKRLSRIKTSVSERIFDKVFTKETKLLNSAHLLFCKTLGFTQNDLQKFRSGSLPSPRNPKREVERLEPVRTLRELRILFEKLVEILTFTNENRKLKKLKKIFKQRRADIRLLRENGDKKTAKKMVFCCSKLMLTLCRK